MDYSNGGFGGGMTMKPRPVMSEEHLLNPRYEAILGTNRSLSKDNRQIGSVLSEQNVVFAGDPDRQPIPVPVAAMICQQCGIPIGHSNFPLIGKFNTGFPGWRHYLVFREPIIWEKDPDYRYIPGYTRYVMSAKGIVKNAHNGKIVKKENSFMFSLVRDGNGSPWNAEPKKVNVQQLMMLAYGNLPDDFIDYGSGRYSHNVAFSKESGTVNWVPLQEIIARHKSTGTAKEYRNIHDFIECEIPAKEYQLAGDIRKYAYRPMTDQKYDAGPFELKAKEPVILSEEEQAALEVPKGAAKASSLSEAAGAKPAVDASLPEISYDDNW